MALDERYIVGINLGEVFVDKTTGEPLTGGTIEYYRDTDRLTAKNVYQLSGSPPNYTYTTLPNPITLSSVGTIQNAGGDNVAVYYLPYDTNDDVDNYYIVVKDSSGTVQFTREAWPNLTTGTSPIDNNQGKVTNELNNSQFVDTWFNPEESYQYQLTSASQEFLIGPDWKIQVTGAVLETVTVQRIELSGNANIPQDPSGSQIINAPYALQFSMSSGITSLKLIQQLSNNPGLFSGGYVSGYLIAKSETSNNTLVTLSYRDSNELSSTAIASANISNAAYTEIKNSQLIPNSTNSSTSATGFVDIAVELPVNETTRISSVQVVGMDQDQTPAAYDQMPVNRQQSLTFNAYKDQIITRAKDSVLCGMNLTLNPWQFSSTTYGVMGTNIAYIPDQVVVKQRSGTNNISVIQATFADNKGLLITPQTTDNQTALIEYLAPQTCRQLWRNKVSCLANVQYFNNNNTTIKVKARLIYRTTAAPAIASDEPIESWSQGGDPVFKMGWTVLTPRNDPAYVLDDTNQFLSFDCFGNAALPQGPSDASNMALVIYTVGDMTPTGTPDMLVVYSASLVPNEFAIDANPLTYNQNLVRCQYYYEKSKASEVLLTTAGAANALVRSQLVLYSAPNLVGYPKTFGFQYKQQKNKNPSITLYAEDGTINSVTATLVRNGVTLLQSTIADSAWAQTNLGDNGLEMIVNSSSSIIVNNAASATNTDDCYITFHYEADARLAK